MCKLHIFVLFSKLVAVIKLRGHIVIVLYLFFIYFVVSVGIGAEE